MARRKLFKAQQWQIVGMNNVGLSTRNIAGQFRVNQSIIVRLLQRYRAAGPFPNVNAQDDHVKSTSATIDFLGDWHVQTLR